MIDKFSKRTEFHFWLFEVGKILQTLILDLLGENAHFGCRNKNSREISGKNWSTEA